MEDNLAKYIRAMGPELGQLCLELQDEFDWLRRKWSEFDELFGKGQERIDLLNEAASNFFYFLHRLFFEDAMLHLCRFTDPAKTRLPSGDRENLTLMSLAAVIPDPVLKALVQRKANQLRDDCKFAREWRNRGLAHKDLITYRQVQASTLPQVNTVNIEDAMKSIYELLTSIGDHYGLPRFALAPDPWGAKLLVRYLDRAKRAIDDEEQHWRQVAKATAPNS